MGKAKPCPCGAPKEPGAGKRYCAECKERTLPIVQQAERMRRRLKANKKRREAGVPKRRTHKDAPDGYKWCPRCVEYRKLIDFSNSAAYCKPCNSLYHHAKNLKRSFGITVEEYEEMLERQDGRCAVCLARPRTQRLAVDHNHKTGAIRGLLCQRCNQKVLGAARENPDILRRAAAYLDDPPAVSGKSIDDYDDFVSMYLHRVMREAATTAAEKDVPYYGAIIPSGGPVETAHVVLPFSIWTDLYLAVNGSKEVA